jgi:hypothetical protein
LHKKKVGGKYYYTTVRKRGEIKSIYLGKNLEEAKKKEFSLNKTQNKINNSNNKVINYLYYLIIVGILLIPFIIQPSFIGYVVLGSNITETTSAQWLKGIYYDVDNSYLTNITQGTWDYVQAFNGSKDSPYNETNIYLSNIYYNGTTANDVSLVTWDNISWFNIYNQRTDQEKTYDSTLDKYIVGYWKLNGDATDETGVNDGVVTGAVVNLTDCMFGDDTGCAYTFDGVDDFINMSNDTSLKLGTDFTIEAWIKASAIGASYYTLLNRQTAATDRNYFLGVQADAVGVAAPGALTFRASSAGVADALRLDGDTVIDDNLWHHTAVTYDGADLTIYVDGVIDNSTAETDAPDLSRGDVMIGSRSDGGANFFDGIIDEVRIYNTSLTAFEINESFARGIAEFNITTRVRTTNETREVYNETGLVGFWKLNNDSDYGENDTLFYDYSPARPGLNNGTSPFELHPNFTSSGFFDGAFNFDGNKSYINISHHDSLEPDDITLEFWVYPKGDAIDSVIAGKGDNGIDQAYYLMYKSTDKFHLGVYTDGFVDYLETPTTYSLNNWYYVVGTIEDDGANMDLKLYVDGELASSSSVAKSRNKTTDSFYIGGYPSLSNYYFNGTIDSVRIYNRTLSYEEIKENYYHANFTDSGWSSIYSNETTKLNSTGGNLTAKYFQYELTFKTNDSRYTPFLRKVEIGWSNKSDIPTQPTISNVQFNESTAYTTNYLNASCEWSDENSEDKLNGSIILYKNDVETFKTDYTGKSLGFTASFILNSSDTAKGEVWIVGCNVSDGIFSIVYSNSSSLTISNSAPTINQTTIINNGTLKVNTQLNCSAGVFDLDLDKTNVTFWWYLNNVKQAAFYGNYSNAINGTLTYAPINITNTTKGDVYICGAKAYDSNEWGTEKNSSSVTILNSAPTTPTSLSPANNTIYGMNTTNLTFTNGTDVDSDILKYNIQIATDVNFASIIHYKSNWSANDTGYSEQELNETTYYWRVNSYDGIDNSSWSNINNFSIDITPPSISSIVYSPNSSNDVDPGKELSFNASVTDTNEVSKVILEYYNGSIWFNKTMGSIGGNLYQTNITLSLTETNYTYRVWANDTVKNSNRTTNSTFESVWECDWVVDPSSQDFGEVSGWDENKEIGNITINNTGDIAYSNNNCSLDFRLTYDLTEGRIYFDHIYYKPSSTYAISAGSNQTIKVNASFLSEIKEESVIITIEDISSRSATKNKTINATLVSTTGGPYLYEKISSAPSFLYLKSQNFSLESYIRNLVGDDSVNNTAYNVSFNWSLPSDFLVKDGKVNLSYINLSDSTLNYNKLNISLNKTNLPSMSPGTVTVYLYGQGYNKTGSLINHSEGKILLNKSTNIILSCYNVSDGIYVTACGSLDGDYITTTTTTAGATAGGGGGGGAGGRITEKEKLFKTEESFDLVRGKEKDFTLTIENPFDGYIKDVNVWVSGYMSKYLDVKPKSVNKIDKNKSVNFTIEIKAPRYFSKGSYNITFIIEGRLMKFESVKNVTTLEEYFIKEKRKITLFIHEVSKEEVLNSLEEALKLIRKLEQNNLSTESLMGIYIKANDSLSIRDYGEANRFSNYAVELAESGLKALEIVNELKDKLKGAEKKGIKTPKTERLKLLAEAALLRGDYETALDRANDAKITYALEVVGVFNLIAFVKNNWWKLIIAGAILGIALFFVFLRVKFWMLNRKIKMLNREEKVLLELIKETQKECFEKGKLSTREYFETLNHYEKKLNKVVQDIIKYETIRANLFKFKKEKDRLLEERKKLVNLIKETQEYYVRGEKFETRVYENKLRSYSSRLAEIEERITGLEAKKAMKKSLKSVIKEDFKKKSMGKKLKGENEKI